MATDFWASSHYSRWIVDRATLRQARTDDLRYVDHPEHLDFLAIYFANIVSKLGKKLQLRQRVIATATVFFRRFYLKNSYCETDPFIVISACCYLAAKAEESPIHIKNIVTESRALFSQELYNVKNFPTDHSKLAEMEFYLVDDLECDLTIFHPYRTLLTLCKKENGPSAQGVLHEETEAGELNAGVGMADVARYWGTGAGQLELSDGALQVAWFIINDTYRSELCLLYPPHLIAITAIYLTLILHIPTRNSVALLLPKPQNTSSLASPNLPTAASSSDLANSQPSFPASASSTTQPRRSSRQAHNTQIKKPQDPITFLSELNVSLPLIATIAQEIISLYALWDRYKEDLAPENNQGGSSKIASPHHHPGSPFSGSTTSATSQKRSASGVVRDPQSLGGTPTPRDDVNATRGDDNALITPVFLSALLQRMRESWLTDMSHPGNGRPVAVNKMLERTQAAG